MTITEAKEQIRNTVEVYLEKDETGEYMIPYMKQRPIFMIGAPGIGKTAIVEQVAAELGIGLVAYSMTHHTRQSAIGLPFISQRSYEGKEKRISEYTVSEIIASVYDVIEKSGVKNGILFLDEINCVSETLAPAILQFLQYKSFGNHALARGWVIVSAGNPPQYNRSVREFDIATRDRLKYIYVDEDFGVWQNYAHDKNVHGAITSFLETNRSWFYSIKTTADGPQYVTARGWEDLSFVLKMYEKKGLKIDTTLILQYVTDNSIARKFSAYYELYRKYREEYRISDILEGRWDELLIKRAKEASFDEHIALVELINEKLLQEISICVERQNVLQDVAKVLREVKKETGDLSKLQRVLEGRIHQLRTDQNRKAVAGALSAEESRHTHLVKQMLEEYYDGTGSAKDGEKAFTAIRKNFEKRAQEQATEIDSVKEKMENSFAFLEKCYETGQEITYYMTIITANRHSSSFVAGFGCDAYHRYNDTLLMKDEKQKLKNEMLAAGLDL